MIPTPKLDDRSFDDIVAEAIRLIPQYCPEWTNHNPTDPGIALIELFAWMTEMTLYRLNRIPEKHQLAFLSLMGVRLSPPQPARTVVQFALHPKAEHARVPAGTRVGTRPAADGSSVIFETESETLVTRNALAKCLSQRNDAFAVLTPALGRRAGGMGRPDGVPLWPRAGVNARHLYFADQRFGALGVDVLLWVRTGVAAAGDVPLCRQMDWAYFDGSRWRDLVHADVPCANDEIALVAPTVPFAPTEIFGHVGLWLRGQLHDAGAAQAAHRCEGVALRFASSGDDEPAELMYGIRDDGVLTRLDPRRPGPALGKEPTPGCAVYLLSERVLARAGAEVLLSVELADAVEADPPRPSADLDVHWEYWNGKAWRRLRRPNDAVSQVNGEPCLDETSGFCRSGSVRFARPEDIHPVEIHGKEGLWVRARLNRGNFGAPGVYELENDRWVWQDPRPLRPPFLRRLGLSYTEPPRGPDRVVGLNNFVFTDWTTQSTQSTESFSPFPADPEVSPTLFLGFREAFSPGQHRVWFDLVEESPADRLDARSADGARDAGPKTDSTRPFAWAFWDGDAWKPLATRDGTRGLSESGFVSFESPSGHVASRRYGESLFWLRARLEMSEPTDLPLLRDIALHAVAATNAITLGEVILGGSNGLPNQTFRFPRPRVLPGLELWVRERERPSGPELHLLMQRFADGAVREDVDASGVWVRWQEVQSLLEAGQRAREFVFDVVNGEVQFGDGVRGMVPPNGDRNVVCRRYRTGGGEAGNVGAEAVCVLQQTVPHVDSVRNLIPATGGCNLEELEEVKRRGPHSLKARDRAVTAEDFEWLALEASGAVARVCTLTPSRREGEVTVFIVPKVNAMQDLAGEKPRASGELLRCVRDYLAERKLLTTVLHVERPRFRELSVSIVLSMRVSAHGDAVRRAVQERVHTFLHPLRGGREGTGWPFGKSVVRLELHQLVDAVPGVEAVESVSLFDEGLRLQVERLHLESGELAHCVRVDVVEIAPAARA